MARKRHSEIDWCMTRHHGYAVSKRLRKRIEEGFGWIKTIGGLAKTHFIGCAKTAFSFTFAAAAYNLIRIPKLIASEASP